MGKYDDIIHLPHPTSKTRPRMSRMDRAAQFAPFAALTGYDAAVKETARLTNRKIELDEYEKAVLDEKMQMISEQLKEEPEIQITYFQPDERKEGGSYQTLTGVVRKIDYFEKCLIMQDLRKIPVDDIAELEGTIFQKKIED